MLTYNVTFVMSPHVEDQFKDWLKRTVSSPIYPILSSPNLQLSTLNPKLNFRLQKVVEIGGEKPGPDHGLSIALQVDFRSKEQADEWGETTLPKLLGGFMNEFGPGAAYFTTLLETTAFK